MTCELPAGRRVAPSILSADYARLGAEVQEVMDAGARVIHVDVMDGHFVPPITIGPLIVDALARAGPRRRGLHRRAPDDRAARAARGGLRASAGADSISIHWESTPHVHYALKTRARGRARRRPGDQPGHAARGRHGRLGLVRHPALHDREPRLGRSGVHPRLDRQGATPALGAAGPRGRSRWTAAWTPTTARPCREAGARLFVAGSAVFGTRDPAGRRTRRWSWRRARSLTPKSLSTLCSMLGSPWACPSSTAIFPSVPETRCPSPSCARWPAGWRTIRATGGILVRHDPAARIFERLLDEPSVEAWLICWMPGPRHRLPRPRPFLGRRGRAGRRGARGSARPGWSAALCQALLGRRAVRLLSRRHPPRGAPRRAARRSRCTSTRRESRVPALTRSPPRARSGATRSGDQELRPLEAVWIKNRPPSQRPSPETGGGRAADSVVEAGGSRVVGSCGDSRKERWQWQMPCRWNATSRFSSRTEDRFEPPEEFVKQANFSDPAIYDEAEKDFEAWWERWAKELDWFEPWQTVLEWNPPWAKWFKEGKLNVVAQLPRPSRGRRQGRQGRLPLGRRGRRRRAT